MRAAKPGASADKTTSGRPDWVDALAADPIHGWVASEWDRAAKVPGVHFDSITAEKAVAFFPTYLCHTVGRWTGRQFVLADWQAAMVRMLFGWKRADGRRMFRRTMVWVARKNGKGIALDTPIPTPSGWTTMGQLVEGDRLYDDNGAECRVTKVGATRYLDCYEIEFSNGERVVCDGDHLWLTTARINRPHKGGAGRKMRSLTRVRDTREIFETQVSSKRGDRNHSLRMPAPIVGRDAFLPLDPYVLGLWLGDGATHYAAITTGSLDRDELVANIRAAGVPVWVSKPKSGSGWLVHLTEGVRHGGARDSFQARLRALGVLGCKRIPESYLRASSEQRLALLQGLMDSDGHVTANGRVIEVVTVSEDLGDDIADLLAGMGLKFSRRRLLMRCNGRAVAGVAHRFQFCVSRTEMPVFRLKRKLARQKTDNSDGRSRTIQVVAVRKVETVPTRCIQVDSPSHQFRCGRTMLPTHNSEFAAGLLLLAFLFDAELGGEAYVIANDKNQAGIVFGRATRMVQLSPTLPEYIETFKTSLYCSTLLSSIKPLSGQAEGKHGLSCSVLVGDEMHEWKNGDLYEFVNQSELSREQPIEILISTAGQAQRSYGWTLWEESLKIRDGVFEDSSTLVVIYAADPVDDWKSPDTWRKANPNLGVSIALDDLSERCKRAQESARLETNFKRYYLNVWVGQDTRWLQIENWRKGSGPPSLKPDARWRAFPEQMKGRACYGSLDLSSTNDLTCLLWMFPPEGERKQWIVIPRFWVPADNIERRARRDRVPYDQWEQRGAIEPTTGNVVDYEPVIAAIHDGMSRYGPKQVGYDPYNARATVNTLMNEGVPMIELRQGPITLGEASKQLERLIDGGLIDSGGHPVLDWMVSNVAKHEDRRGNITPDKSKSSEKIDGIVCMVMDLALATTTEEAAPKYQMIIV